MNKFILPLLISCTFNMPAFAVDMNTATTEDPKKADELLKTTAQTKKLSLEERREALKKKHSKKKAALAEAAIAPQAAVVKSSDNTPVSNAAVEALKAAERDSKIQENKELNAPSK